MHVSLHQIARARSGDKGASANIGVVARSPNLYIYLLKVLTSERVAGHFSGLGVGKVTRFELPNLMAMNFVLTNVLGDGGGSLSLRSDAQGKALGQAMLEMQLDLPDELSSALVAETKED